MRNKLSQKPTLPTRRVKKWTLTLVLEFAVEVHGDAFDYSLILEEHIKGCKSLIPIKCKKCQYQWSPTIHDHIRGKSGCMNCLGRVRWTLARFLIRAVEIHGYKYDYSQITEKHIKNKYSYIPIKCNVCEYEWETMIHAHIQGANCPDCEHKVSWNLSRFLIRAEKIHGNKYNYSAITDNDIKTLSSNIIITCNTCKYEWSPTVRTHIKSKCGCPKCNDRLLWTLERFLTIARDIHMQKYDYSLILDNDINGAFSIITIKCNTCFYQWNSSVTNHINSKSGCPKCNFSKGELKCSEALTKLNIPYQSEYILEILPRKRFDFMFTIYNKNYLLEYDGNIHFIEAPYFKTSLKSKQEIDILKTKIAIQENYSVIRIDYTQMKNIEYHINKAIEQNNKIYYSTPEMYSYIIDNL